MSIVDHVSNIPAKHLYSAGVMYRDLEDIIAGKSVEIPKGVLYASKRLFDLSVYQIRLNAGVTKFDLEIHMLEAMTTYNMVSDIIRKVTDSPDATTKEIDMKIELLTNALQNPGTLFLRHEKGEYEVLMKFFRELHSMAGEAMYEEAMSGQHSRYSWTL